MQIDLNKYSFDCSICTTRCDKYPVKQFDLEFGHEFFDELKENVVYEVNNNSGVFQARLSTKVNNSIIEVTDPVINQVVGMLYVAGNARTYMSSTHFIKDSGLIPSEAIGLKVKDLQACFDLVDQSKVTVLVVLTLIRRPCIVGTRSDSQEIYYQDIDKLKKIKNLDVERKRTVFIQKWNKRGNNFTYEEMFLFSLNEFKNYFPKLTNYMF